MENATSSCASQDSTQPPAGAAGSNPGPRHGTRIKFCPPWPNPAHGAWSRSRPTSSPNTSQFDAILPANTLTPTPRPPAHPKNAWPFYPGASEPLREQPFVCRPAASPSDHGDADLCHPLIRCRVGPQHRAPARANRRRHWPHASLSTCPSHEGTRPISLAMQRGLPDASRIRGWEGGSQIDLIHVSDVQLTDF